MEGRDIGSVVFPDAPIKIYLDASPLPSGRGDARQIRRTPAARRARSRPSSTTS